MQQEKQKTNKSLMRLERPYYEFKKKQESETEFIVRKLVNKNNQKPQIGHIQRSPLLTQMQSVLPIFKRANEELTEKVDNELEHIDKELLECASSSQSQQSQQQLSGMVDEKEEKRGQVEINFLRYPYPPTQMKGSQSQQGSQKAETKNSLIEQI